MSKNTIEAGVVSWELFDTLYENQADFCRKLRFLVKAGRATEEGRLALDIICDLLNSKEKDITELRVKAFEQRRHLDGLIARDDDLQPSSQYAEISERISILEKLESIRQEAGYPWENIKSIIEGTYSSMHRRTEEQ